MNWKKAVSLIGAVAVLSVALVGCGNNNSASTAKSTDKPKDKTYIIACDAKYAPFSMEVNGVYKGIDVEIIDAISKEEGFKYELKPMDFNGIIPGLVSGQIDGSIAGMNITEDRKKSVDFSDPYYTSAYAVVVNNNNDSIHKLEDITGKTAAVKKGTTGAKFAEDNKEKYNLNISYFDDSPSMMMAVSNGNADFLFEDLPVIAYQIKIGEQKNLKIALDSIQNPPPVNGFAVKKDANGELLKMFNDGLKKIKANGTYDKIVKQYQ